MSFHCFTSISRALLFVLSLSSFVIASIPQTFRHANLLRTIDLTKPYIRDSTALILENIGNVPQTEYFWGVPLELASRLSYLEVKEKKTGSTDLFPVERAQEDHEYPRLIFRKNAYLKVTPNIQDHDSRIEPWREDLISHFKCLCRLSYTVPGDSQSRCETISDLLWRKIHANSIYNSQAKDKNQVNELYANFANTDCTER